jgi:hypothetical protein
MGPPPWPIWWCVLTAGFAVSLAVTHGKQFEFSYFLFDAIFCRKNLIWTSGGGWWAYMKSLPCRFCRAHDIFHMPCVQSLSCVVPSRAHSKACFLQFSTSPCILLHMYYTGEPCTAIFELQPHFHIYLRSTCKFLWDSGASGVFSPWNTGPWALAVYRLAFSARSSTNVLFHWFRFV